MPNNNKYNLIIKNPQSTVLAEYTPLYKTSAHYQSEAELEKTFIEQLKTQAYEYINIKSEETLIWNLRKQLEKLNNLKFTNDEWKRFYKNELANQNQSVAEKTATIQEDYIKILKRDDKTTKNIYLLNKKQIHDNSLQIINQYTNEDGQRVNRYDVTILVNGLPLVHIELKRRGIDIREAFNQIERYQRESFWAGCGLFEYVQLFVISNGTQTKYYSNTTREQHLQATREGIIKKGKRYSHSFEFTNWWADANNNNITDLNDFVKTFFAKHTLLNILTCYCVFTSDSQLLVMRPYQIVATEKILNKIIIATNYKKLGTTQAGGYIWHTTGSGKTLTSFKTAQLTSKLTSIKKVLFVVDRKDLDYQTMREYDKFEKGAANGNNSTAILKKQLEDSQTSIIITTIQKLNHFINKNKNHNIYQAHVVIIFDECHRSQFGQMHTAIIKAFKKYHLFGFTGTPIFAENAAMGSKSHFKTTEQAFGDKLHTYTIVNAIDDKNVLPFKVDYISTMHKAENIIDVKVKDIDREAALASPQRLNKIVHYVYEHFGQKTRRDNGYKWKNKRLKGFNSILTVASIEMAKKYYAEFQKQSVNIKQDEKLKIAMIYSFASNEEDSSGMNDENLENTNGLDRGSRDFLDKAISDYNQMFGTSFDTSADKFQNYYRDLSERVKNREVDLLIVVNMFLTGFDATTLNTLWVDKNLRLHGLLQAFSRTNRVLNSIKTSGNIVCFRNLEKATNQAISLFGDKKALGIVLLKTYAEYYNGYQENNGKQVQGYKSLIEQLFKQYPIGQKIISEQKQKNFVKLYGGILRMRNILTTFDEFEGEGILNERQIQDYHSIYIDFYNSFRKKKDQEKENINDDVVFEIELIKQTEINIDYILNLVDKYHNNHIKEKHLLTDIKKAIDSSMELRNKKDLINQFIEEHNSYYSVEDKWKDFVKQKKIEELKQIIKVEQLNPEKTYKFVYNAFRDEFIPETGTAISEILPPMSRFSKDKKLSKKREKVLDKLIIFFKKYFDISNPKL